MYPIWRWVNPVTNHLLTSWDIQVVLSPITSSQGVWKPRQIRDKSKTVAESKLYLSTLQFLWKSNRHQQSPNVLVGIIQKYVSNSVCNNSTKKSGPFGKISLNHHVRGKVKFKCWWLLVLFGKKKTLSTIQPQTLDWKILSCSEPPRNPTKPTHCRFDTAKNVFHTILNQHILINGQKKNEAVYIISKLNQTDQSHINHITSSTLE